MRWTMPEALSGCPDPRMRRKSLKILAWMSALSLALGVQMGCSDDSLPAGPQDAGWAPDRGPEAALPDLKPDAPPEGSLPLVRNGASMYQIVLNPGASASEKRAALEIQDAVKAASGATLPIATQAPDGGGPMLVLGTGAVSSALGVAPQAQTLGSEGYHQKTVPPHIVIAGTAAGGTLHGAHRFLEQHLGVRWLAPGTTLSPARKDIWVPPADKIVKPAFAFRQTSYAWPGKDSQFLSRVAFNAGSATADSEWGAQIATWGRAHTYFTFVNPAGYFATHPEYFSEIGGKRRKGDTQLCLTNPEVLDIAEKKMLDLMKQNPGVSQFGFSQSDDYNYCRCSTCQAMNTQYKTTGGTQFYFVNELAKRTAKVYPDKLVTTLAYMYTEAPPVGLTLHPNVAIWLCHMFPSCDSHPIETCPKNATYKQNAQAWAALTKNLYVWHYIVNFTHYYEPFPNLRAMGSHLKFYRDLGVKGVYLQGMSASGGGGEWSLLRPYIGMKLLWDPDQDPDKLVQDFLSGYYGAAHKPLWEYIQLVHDKVKNDNIHMHLYTNPAQGYLTDEVLAKAKALFDQAETLVQKDATLLARVQMARHPLTYASFFPRGGYSVGTSKLTFLGLRATIAELWAMIQSLTQQGFKEMSEMIGDSTTFLFVANLMNGEPQVVSLKNAALQVDVVPTLGGRVLRIVQLATGKEVTASNRTTSMYYPFCGGLEAQVGSTFRYYGWIEPATVVTQTGTSVVLRTNLTSNLTLMREIKLDAQKAILRVTERVENPGAAAIDARLRADLALDLGDLSKVRYSFTSVGGAVIDSDLTQVRAGLREGKDFYGKDLPAGAWTLSGSTGLKVIQRFTAATTDHTLLVTYPEEQRELHVQLWSTDEQVPPGKSIQMAYELEVQ